MNSSNVDKAICFVNKIVDNVRCATCDKLGGTRVRYQCGHIACDACVIYAPECQCCTPPSQSCDIPKYDKHLTQTVKSAVGLLKACHKLFDMTAFQRKRISEQLKIEKELFPNCIQAPVKYENKRKISNKANESRTSTIFPGEEISPFIDMANPTNYVQQWLRNNETNLARKPFSDLNVNTSWTNSPKINKSKNIKQLVGENNVLNASRKRTLTKITDSKCTRQNKRSAKSGKNYENIPKKVEKQYESFIEDNNTEILKKCDKDESGIFMENETIVIDDSQEPIIDKDRQAWLSVLKACQNEDLESTSIVNLSSRDCTNDNTKPLININEIEVKNTNITNVPFFKRSAIVETCKYCKDEVDSVKTLPEVNETKPVKITIDGDSFITTISVFTNVDSSTTVSSKKTVSIQTEICKEGVNTVDCNETNIPGSEKISAIEMDCDDVQSEDLFADDKKILEAICQTNNVGKGLVIQESDSDTDLDVSGPMSIKADVHRSCEESDFQILHSVVNVKKHESKPRRRPRGHTPTSTDSSEKENYNPNRIKRVASVKKKYSKK